MASYLNLGNCHEKQQTTKKAKLPFHFCQNVGRSLTHFWMGSDGTTAWQRGAESHVGRQGAVSLYRGHQLCGLPGAISNAFLIFSNSKADDSPSLLRSPSQGLQCLSTYTRSCFSWATVRFCSSRNILSMHFSWLLATPVWVYYPVVWCELW